MLKGAFATNKIQYNNINLDLKLRKLFHTTYIRSKLLYAFENINLNKSQLAKLTKTDAMIIKKGLSLNKYSSVSKILAILDLRKLESVIATRKLNFILQLPDNAITNSIIDAYNENCVLNEKSILSELGVHNFNNIKSSTRSPLVCLLLPTIIFLLETF